MKCQQSRVSLLEKERSKIDRDIKKSVDRIVEAESSAVMTTLEKRMVIQEKMVNCSRQIRGHSENYRIAMEFLAQPYKFWASERLEGKRAALKLAFTDRLTYVRGKDYRTAKTTLPFRC